jgi:hypothetical protein
VLLLFTLFGVHAHLQARERNMPETNSAPLGGLQMEDQRLTHLLTYTTFHIGVYVTLAAALIAAGTLTSLEHGLLRFSTFCFLVAGACGGVVGSSIPEFTKFDEFAKRKLGPWNVPIATYSTWVTAEHLAFWIGIGPLVLGYVFCGPDFLRGK